MVSSSCLAILFSFFMYVLLHYKYARKCSYKIRNILLCAFFLCYVMCAPYHQKSSNFFLLESTQTETFFYILALSCVFVFRVSSFTFLFSAFTLLLWNSFTYVDIYIYFAHFSSTFFPSFFHPFSSVCGKRSLWLVLQVFSVCVRTFCASESSSVSVWSFFPSWCEVCICEKWWWKKHLVCNTIIIFFSWIFIFVRLNNKSIFRRRIGKCSFRLSTLSEIVKLCFSCKKIFHLEIFFL